MILFVKLLIAHLVGDFVLQPTSWVVSKETKGLKSVVLYGHSFLHGLLSWLIVWELEFWSWALLITAIHFSIDLLKIALQKESTKRVFFFVDQSLHILSIYLICLCYSDFQYACIPVFDEKMLWFVAAVIFLAEPIAIAIRVFISKWSPHTGDAESESLESAGKYIGMIERLFVFLFVVLNHWEAIGFLLAAKSIFRFGDLKEAKDRKLTEYMLIGTLVSFGAAILVGLMYLKLAIVH